MAKKKPIKKRKHCPQCGGREWYRTVIREYVDRYPFEEPVLVRQYDAEIRCFRCHKIAESEE